jgi:hypothetical protein
MRRRREAVMSKRQVTDPEPRRGLPWWANVLLAALTGAIAAVVSTAGGRAAVAPAVAVVPAAATEAAAGPPAPPPTAVTSTMAPPAAGCHPGYQGTCIPAAVSDADCYGMGENGPWFVREYDVQIVGADVFRLDVDFDGVACESHPGLQ